MYSGTSHYGHLTSEVTLAQSQICFHSVKNRTESLCYGHLSIKVTFALSRGGSTVC